MGRLTAEQQHRNRAFCWQNEKGLYIHCVPKENVSTGANRPRNRQAFMGVFGADAVNQEILNWHVLNRGTNLV